ncbi:aldehyde dehydrogenase [Xylariomycetidae sp. FL2044]|nr:aldehyde dehydrogenase [Xylariomycetidae sp. FL2044]
MSPSATNGDAASPSPSSPSSSPSAFEFYNIIDGVPRTSEEKHQVTDPRTEEALWDCPVATPGDLDDAVAAAHRAFRTWGRSTLAERHRVLRDLARILYDQAAYLGGEIQRRETGKARALSTLDVERAGWHYEYATTIALEDEVQYEDDQVRIVGTHCPLGVLGAISPWNFPMILSSVKVASALAMGNCVIIKPSPFTPYSLLKFCELAQAVVPPGVFQVLSGGADLGERMTLHPGIQHISFTGTTAVGRRILQNCAAGPSMKKVILELAGNNACVVCDDVDLAKVVPLVAQETLFHAGQVCVASKRVYVHEAIYDRFLDALVEEAKKYAPDNVDGDGEDKDFNLFSPLSNRANYERLLGFIDDCKANGYKIVAGGEVQRGEKGRKGFWVSPTIVSKPPEDALVVREEQFGPVVPVLSWTDEDDVIARANLDNAGLGASVYTPDLARAQRLARRLECGTVWINHPARPHHGGYFEGWKASGFNGELGKWGLKNYCQVQSIQIGKA